MLVGYVCPCFRTIRRLLLCKQRQGEFVQVQLAFDTWPLIPLAVCGGMGKVRHARSPA